MKTLLIGMDGAQVEIFRRGWTPFLESLIDTGTELSLKEDLISRGWAEIFTGEHAILTGAMYERPVLNGTYRWTDKFSLGDIPGLGYDVKPLWQVLNERGYRVGVMNLPTTYPAPMVEGFFVSGGGGGGDINQEVGLDQCNPTSVKVLLDEMGYIVDERLPSLLGEKKLYEPAQFFSRLEEMNEKRTSSFIKLSNQYAVDFGFLVYKSSIVTTENLVLPELSRYRNGVNDENSCFWNAVKKFYKHLDEQVRKLVETFPQAEVIIVSDHGLAVRHWSVNFNAFLSEKGYQRKSVSRRRVFEYIHSYRHWIPYSLRKKMKGSPYIKSAYESMITFAPHASRAFNITLTNAIHGIYINDKERFGGPVESSDIVMLQEMIIRDFNEHEEVKKHGMSARMVTVSEGECPGHFPDIIIDMPDGYMPSNEYPGFVTEYPVSDIPLDLKEMMYDKRISVKGHNPLAVIINGSWRARPVLERADLRIIYDHVLSTFPEKKD